MNTQSTVSISGEIRWRFKPRWIIRGCLVTETPLFIGSGGITTRPGLMDDDGKPVEIADCARGADGRPVLPGSGLRGVLRTWLERNTSADASLLDQVFGQDSQSSSSGRGGEAEILDAPLTLARTGDPPLPHWDRERQTWVEIINSIDREHGAAAENHLAHFETVAPGCGFEVIITGQSEDPDRVIALLLAALEGFNHPDTPLTLGGGTASGKGRLRWELCGVEKMTAADAMGWLRRPSRGMAMEEAFKAVTHPDLTKLREQACRLQTSAENRTILPLALYFDGPFLVNDPPPDKIEGEADARPRRDAAGRALLPAKSVRGVLRTRGEKILRTLLDLDEAAWQRKEIQHWVHRRIACRPEIAALACPPLRRAEDREDVLCLACQLFGAPGWRSPLEISDFVLASGETQIQEMLAVDRFTGGGKAGAKYNAEAVIDPLLKGRIALDRRRAPSFGLGLLALVLRDLAEGELGFGWGAAGKGYGRCHKAEIEGWENADFKQEATESWRGLIEKITELRKQTAEITAAEQSGKSSATGQTEAP